MASEEIIINVVSQYKDNVSAGMAASGQEADKFVRKVDKAAKSASKLGKTKVSTKLDVDDKATAKITKLEKAQRTLTGKAAKLKLDVLDQATGKIKKIGTAAKSFAGKRFQALLSVKDQASSVLSRIKNKVFSLQTLIAGLGTAAVVKKGILDPISLSDQFTTYEIGFSTMLKSAEKGKKFLEEAKNFAKITPFDTSDVVSNAQSMMAFGFDSKDILSDLEIMGNAAAALGTGSEGIGSMTKALGQMKTGGKLHAEEMNQLTEAGVNAWKYLADAEGVSVAKMRDMVSSGSVSGEEAVNKILKGMKEFDGMMDKTSNSTVSGLMSNIQDTFDISIVSKWGKGLANGATKGLSQFASWLDKSDAKLKKAGTSLEKLGEYASTSLFNALGNAGARLDKVIGSDKFKNASIGGKINIAWDEMIAQPFSDWWEGKGKPAIVGKLKDIGKEVGKAAGDWVKESLKDLLPGGDKASIEDYLLAYLGINAGTKFLTNGKGLLDLLGLGGSGGSASLGSVGAMTVSASVVYLSGGTSVGDGNGGSVSIPTGKHDGKSVIPESKVPGTSTSTKGQGTLGKITGTVTGGLATVGKSFGTGAATTAGQAVAGGATLFGIAGTIAGLVSSATNFVNAGKANKEGDKATRNKELARGGTKLGMMGAGAATGAAIGSVLPGIGTAIGAITGAGIGGLAGALKGNKIADSLTSGLKKFFSKDVEAGPGVGATSSSKKKGDSGPIGSAWKKIKSNAASKESTGTAMGYSGGKTKKSKTAGAGVGVGATGKTTKSSKSFINSMGKGIQKALTKASKRGSKGAGAAAVPASSGSYSGKQVKSSKNLTTTTDKATKETKSYTTQSKASAKTVKSYGATTKSAGGKVSGLGANSSSAGASVSGMGSSASGASGSLQSAGSSALSLSGAFAAAASAIRSAAASAQASAASAAAASVHARRVGNGSGRTSKNAKGGYIGNHIISELGEEGPEMVIPLSKHRSRALALWQQAGESLGVTHHAKGGVVGGTLPKPSGKKRAGSGGGNRVSVNVGGIRIEVNVDGNSSDGNVGSGVVEAIRSKQAEIADILMGAIADACQTAVGNQTREAM